MPLDDLKEIDAQKEKIERNTRQFVRGQAGQQRAADRRARHRQVLADQRLPARLCAAGAAPDRGRQGRADRPARHRRGGVAAAREVHRLLRRPELRRGRAGLQGAQVDPRRLGGRGHAQRADLRDQQPAPPAARVHEGQPQLHPHRGRRGASGRGDRREDLAVRALRPVGQLLSLQPERIPGDRRAVAVVLRRRCRRRSRRRGAEALVWALERGSRSGRVAYQFARDYAGGS